MGLFDLNERLYKVICFWRIHGTKALIHLVLFKLKTKDTPTVAHILDSEVRPVSKGWFDTLTKDETKEITTFRFEVCSPLRAYSTPTDKPSRISIVTDSINSGSLYGGVGTAMIMAALLAEARHARLRVVTRTERAHTGNLAHVLETYGISLSHEVEFVFAPFHDHRYEIDIFGDELFITTSWWTTAATMASVPHDSIIYLLQEDERMFYPYGDDHLRCSQILRSRDIRFVINTRLLFEHLVADGLDNIAERGVWFEPAFPREVFHPRARENYNKRTLMFYARPNNLRNLFYFGIELIEEAVMQGIVDLTQWDILLVGKDIQNVRFADDYTPEKRENLTWAEYAEIVGKVDIGLCLMYTPHPSYPPLDLAASGAVVVTNRFGNKRDLSNYSRNIVCGDLDRESMIAALAEGIRLATSTAERAENHRSSALGSDWRLAFSEVLQHFSEVH